MTENQPFTFLVTHVEADGQYLKIWAQTDEKVVQSVDSLLHSLQDKLEHGVSSLSPRCTPSNFGPNTLCCARRPDTSKFCRARILEVCSGSMLRLCFVDYGIVAPVPLNRVRLLDGIPEASYLFVLPEAASPFILADIMPVGGHWINSVVAEIRSILVDKHYVGVFRNAENFRIIKFNTHDGVDFSTALIDNNMSVCSVFNQQAVQVPITVTRNDWQGPVLHNTTPTLTGKGIQLEIDSTQDVIVSSVEDGPFRFSVQLLSCLPYLNAMMEKINSTSPNPLQNPFFPSVLCLGKQTETSPLCRVVILSPGHTSCEVLFSDYGYHEILPYTSIYQIPNEFVAPKPYAIRFTLSDIMNWNKSQDLKNYFGGLVHNKSLKLVVRKGPMSPLVNYCDLYVNGENVKDILRNTFPNDCTSTNGESQTRRLQQGSGPTSKKLRR